MEGEGFVTTLTTSVFCGLVRPAQSSWLTILIPKLDLKTKYLWGKSNGPHMCPLPRNEVLRMGQHWISAWIHGSQH